MTSILCNKQQKQRVPKALEPNLNENEVSAMDRKCKGIMHHFQLNQVNIIHKTLKQEPKGLESNLTENEGRAWKERTIFIKDLHKPYREFSMPTRSLL